ncbi:MAG: ATP-binding protein [Nitrososphaeria archaeon]
MNEKEIVGSTIGGTYSTGVVIKLKGISHENIEVGYSLVAKGKTRSYLMIVNDIIAGSSNAAEALNTSKKALPMKDLLSDSLLTSKVNCIPIASSTTIGSEDALTIPDYLSECSLLSREEAETFYGSCDLKKEYPLGTIKPTDSMVPIDIDLLIQNSFGIFGKSGTGKSVLGNLIAGYIVMYSNYIKLKKKDTISPTLLIFDMHSEYGLKLRTDSQKTLAAGVAQTFPEEFRVYCVDSFLVGQIEREFRRGTLAKELKVKKKNIEVEDIVVLSELLKISGAGSLNLQSVKGKLEKLSGTWFEALLNFENFEQKTLRELDFEQQVITSLRAFSRRLSPFKDFPQLSDTEDTCQELVNDLKSNKNVVISFGKYGDSEVLYMFIVNYISRRLRDEYTSRGIFEETSNRIVIFVEEAHKFLNPAVKESSPLGLIARELRKRGIVLCIIDQTPSQIDENVFGMIWNFLVGATNIDRDIEVSTRAMRSPELFKPLVATLRRQEFLVYGSAIRFPSVVKVVDYASQMEGLRQSYENEFLPNMEKLSKSFDSILDRD